jgi:5'-methylthioadenosine phosphorylase
VAEPQHVRAKKGDVAERAVISGDPARVRQLSRLLKRPKLVSDFRGFIMYTGERDGTRFTIACHGIGGPSAAIVIEELVMLGAKAIVRLGTCGGLLKDMRVGDLVVATSAGYLGGTLDHYYGGRKVVPRPDEGLTRVLEESAKGRGLRCFSGKVFSSDAFYTEQSEFVGSRMKGCVAVEMECATLFGLGMLRKVKTACVLLASDNMTKDAPMADASALRPFASTAAEVVFDSLGRTRV